MTEKKQKQRQWREKKANPHNSSMIMPCQQKNKEMQRRTESTAEILLEQTRNIRKKMSFEISQFVVFSILVFVFRDGIRFVRVKDDLIGASAAFDGRGKVDLDGLNLVDRVILHKCNQGIQLSLVLIVNKLLRAGRLKLQGRVSLYHNVGRGWNVIFSGIKSVVVRC